MRLLDLYRHTDPALARALEERIGLAAIARAGGMDRREQAGRGRRAPGRCAPISPKSAGHGGQISRAAGRPAHRRARLRRLGHARRRRRRERAAREPARRARRRHCRDRDRAWARPGARPSSPSSPSSAAPRASTAPTAPTTARHGRAARRRRAQGRPRRSPTGRASSDADLLRGTRPQADDRSARVLKGVLKDHLRVDESRACGQGLSRQRPRKTNDRAAGLIGDADAVGDVQQTGVFEYSASMTQARRNLSVARCSMLIAAAHDNG